MRVSLHPERGLIVLSLWVGATCRASFQLPLDEAVRLSEVLESVTVSNASLAVTDASIAVTHAAPAVTDPATVPVEGAALAS